MTISHLLGEFYSAAAATSPPGCIACPRQVCRVDQLNRRVPTGNWKGHFEPKEAHETLLKRVCFTGSLWVCPRAGMTRSQGGPFDGRSSRDVCAFRRGFWRSRRRSDVRLSSRYVFSHRPHLSYNDGCVSTHFSLFAIYLMNSYPKDSIQQSRRLPSPFRQKS